MIDISIEELKSWIGCKVTPTEECVNWIGLFAKNKIGTVIGYDKNYRRPLFAVWPTIDPYYDLRSGLHIHNLTELDYDVVPGGHFRPAYVIPSDLIKVL